MKFMTETAGANPAERTGCAQITDRSTILASILDAMAECGVAPAQGQAALNPDGDLHRYQVEGDKASSRNGWYVIHMDHSTFAEFGSWKSGARGSWRAKANHLGTCRDQRKRIENERAQHTAVQQQKWGTAATRALEQWRQAKPAHPDHPYLLAKRVSPRSARQINDRLILPVVTVTGVLSSLQFISRDGTKLLLKGGRKHSCFIPVSGRSGIPKVLICEGWATGATLAEACPEALVLAAIDAGNLKHVASEYRRRYPDAGITICADDDRHTAGNPGVTNARAAALAVGGQLAIPEWPPDAPDTLTDFNDLAVWLEGGAT